MIQDYCVSCGARIVRDFFTKIEYNEKYGNYCRTCSANPKQAKRILAVLDEISLMYRQYDLEHPTEEQYQLLEKALKKELGKKYEAKNNQTWD